VLRVKGKKNKSAPALPVQQENRYRLSGTLLPQTVLTQWNAGGDETLRRFSVDTHSILFYDFYFL